MVAAHHQQQQMMVQQQQGQQGGSMVFGSLMVDANSSTPYTDATLVSQHQVSFRVRDLR